MGRPDFIVIGAAKAGTTAMYWYLAEHPQVFMSEVKETNYFAYETDTSGRLLYGVPELHRFPVRTEAAYANLFTDTGNARVAGEASPMYLECPRSALRIHEALPNVRIICGLRNPVDRAYSDYLMYLRGIGHELDPDRDLSMDAEWTRPDSHWMRVSRYHDALQRYFELFPRDHVHVFLTDDMKKDALDVVRQIYAFVGVDETFTPDFSTPYNVGGVPASPTLERAFNAGAAVRLAVEPWIPRPALKWLRKVRAGNMQKPPALPASLRHELLLHFEDDIDRTAELIGRDLSHWKEQGIGRATPAAYGAGIAPGESRAI